MGLRILMICQHYWPEHFQITDVCEELVRRGHEVTALVGLPNYPTGVIPEEYRDGRNRDQEHNGVRIVRCEEVPRSSGIKGLARNYLSFMLSSKAKARQISEPYDVIFAYQLSPVLMVSATAEAKRATGAPAVMYCADIWPDAFKAMLPDKFSFLMPVMKAWSTSIYHQMDYIATNSSAYVDCFEQVHGIDRSRLVYMPQYAEDTYLDMNLDPEPDPDGRTRFMVMGNIGRLQHMQDIMEAVNILRDRDDFVLHIVGTGSVEADCRRFVEEHGLQDKVIFHGRHPFEEMPDFYRMADACVLTLDVPGAPWISSTLPSRLQGYMGAGKPVLAAISGSAADVIRESGCGRAVPAGDAQGLAGLMADFINNKGDYAGCGEAGRSYFRAHFGRQRYMDDIEALLVVAAREGKARRK